MTDTKKSSNYTRLEKCASEPYTFLNNCVDILSVIELRQVREMIYSRVMKLHPINPHNHMPKDKLDLISDTIKKREGRA